MTAESQDTGLCRKCKSEIPLDADRCRECGFEPTVGILGKILVWVSLMWGSTFAVIALASLIVIFDGFPVRDGLIAAGVFGFLSMIGFGYVARKWEVYKQKPAIQPSENVEEADIDLGDVSDELRESWREGRERGDRFQERINNIPDWAFNAVILTGAILSLSVWVTAVYELETAMMVGLIGGLVLVGMGVALDVERTNRVRDTHFRAWFWSILAIIPLVGWIAGVGWIIRRRRAIE